MGPAFSAPPNFRSFSLLSADPRAVTLPRPPVMFLMERHERIPIADVSAFVQRCVEAGATIVVVTRNPDGFTCTVSVQRD